LTDGTGKINETKNRKWLKWITHNNGLSNSNVANQVE